MVTADNAVVITIVKISHCLLSRGILPQGQNCIIWVGNLNRYLALGRRGMSDSEVEIDNGYLRDWTVAKCFVR